MSSFSQLSVLAVLAMGLTCATSIQAQDTPKKTPDLEVETEVAFGGYYRPNSFISAQVELLNRGKARRVNVVVKGASVLREVSVDLAQSARKRFPLLAPVPSVGSLWLEVWDEQGKNILGKSNLGMQRITANTTLMAYVGKRPPGLKRSSLDDAFDFQSPNDPALDASDPKKRWRSARTTLVELPRNYKGYEALTALFWADPKFDRLEPEQVVALKRWIVSGGHLVVAVDDGWRQVAQSAMADFLPGELVGVEVLSSLPDVNALLKGAEGTPLGQVQPPKQLPWLKVQSRAGAENVGFGQHPMKLTWSRGDGRVTLWRVGWSRLGLQWPLATWGDEATQGLYRLRSEYMWQIPQRDEPRLDINIIALVLVLLAYVLYIGPVDYLVLRSLKRLEWTVWTYSASIVLFGALAWIVMTSSQDDTSLLSRVELVSWHIDGEQLAKEDDEGRVMTRVDVFSGYFTTTRERLQLEPPQSKDLIWVARASQALSGVLGADQELRGNTPNLKATAAAYAMLPVRRETYVPLPARPLVLKQEFSESSQEQEQAQKITTINSALEFPMECHMLSEEGVSPSFQLPPNQVTAVPETSPHDGRELSMMFDGEHRTALGSLVPWNWGVPGRVEVLCVASGSLVGAKLALAADVQHNRLVLRFVFSGI